MRDARRRQILAAAVKVFAARGYHACRIRDVADEAGIAYGLVYHYFGSKAALLELVFDENWQEFADAVEGIAGSDKTPPDKVRAVVDYVFGAYATYPDVVKVVVLEYGRTARVGQALDHPHVARTIRALRTVFSEARDLGQLLPGTDPFSLTVLFMGALEATLAATLLPRDAAPLSEQERLQRMRTTLEVVFRQILRDDAAHDRQGESP